MRAVHPGRRVRGPRVVRRVLGRHVRDPAGVGWLLPPLRSRVAGLFSVGRVDRRAMQGGLLQSVSALENAGLAESPLRHREMDRAGGRVRLGQLDPRPV